MKAKVPWTEADNEFVISHFATMTSGQMAAHLGRTRVAVDRQLTRLRLAGRIDLSVQRQRGDLNAGKDATRQRLWKVDEDNFLIENHAELTNKQLGQRIGRSEGAIARRISRLRREGKITLGREDRPWQKVERGNRTKQAELIYMAAIYDAFGTLIIKRRPSFGPNAHRVRLAITMPGPQVRALFAEHFGGARERSTQVWYATDKILLVVEALYPYMRLCKEESSIAIQWLRHQTDETLDLYNAAVQQRRAANT
jgi:biotin operon repressor